MELKRWSSNQVLEYWKDKKDYEGIYQVSSCGRIKSLERKVKHSSGNGFRTVEERVLKLRISNKGYLRVILSKNGKMKEFLVHRLVLSTFKPIPNMEEMDCNHIDENKQNNNVKNLEWMTHYENINWGTRNKRASENHANFKGEKNPSARKVRCIETGVVFDCIKYAVEWCGLKSHMSIIRQIQGKSKYAGKHPITGVGLHWEYVDEVELDLNLLNIDNIKISL